jgi:hypothetical protein
MHVANACLPTQIAQEIVSFVFFFKAQQGTTRYRERLRHDGIAVR